MKQNIILTIILLSFSANIAFGQCFPDRHNTNWFDGWISCETAPNPKSAYGDSHWILYDFKESYELGQMQVWNSNDPSHLDYGMQEVAIDYSLDGIDWVQLGNYEFEIASGKSIYEGFEGPDFDGAFARYVLITGLSNYGGECFGLSEIRIAVEESSVATEEVSLDVDCSTSSEGVLLEWTVQGKLDGVQYLIERSKDTENWTRIKETEIFDLGDGTHTFHYIDNGITDASAYYRLISRMKDGQEEVSKSHFCSREELEVRVYPNPMHKAAKLEIMSQGSDELHISITDVFGRVLYQDALVPTSISTSISLDDLKFQNGNYFVNVRQGRENRAVKLVKL